MKTVWAFVTLGVAPIILVLRITAVMVAWNLFVAPSVGITLDARAGFGLAVASAVLFSRRWGVAEQEARARLSEEKRSETDGAGALCQAAYLAIVSAFTYAVFKLWP